VPAWNILERRAGFPYPVPSPLGLQKVKRLVAQCDAVHLHDCIYATNLAIYRVARKLRRPIVLTQHVLEVPYESRWVRALQAGAYRRLVLPRIRRAHVVVFVSEPVRKRFAGHVAPERAHLLENGLDLSLFPLSRPSDRDRARRRLELSATDTVLLFAGRFVQKKGLEHVKRAAAARPGWQWVLAGSAGDVDPRQWGLANVRIMPPVQRSGMSELYAAADLLVLPSVGEGLPVVIQEAIATGLHVVTSSETASALGERSWFVSEWTGAGSLVDAITDALTIPPDVKRAAVEAARLRWGVDRVAEEYEKLLCAVTCATESSSSARL
jgi:glycosyltransferase involved in cell wall biosynthesis